MRNFQTFILGEITPTNIHAYREFLQEQVPPAAPATIDRRLAALRRFFAWTKERQLVHRGTTGRTHLQGSKHRTWAQITGSQAMAPATALR
ncbi:MAG TPA: hypothetical protein VKB35_03230 [Ktedonobacteraceae bacterium]|nr:hypothetical protein [Ktedonobacteraceae bacterium]